MRNMTALVAVKDTDWREMYEEALQRKGCKVVTTADGMDGIQMLSERSFDIAIVDESLDSAGQVEVVLSIRDLKNHKPVTLVTGKNVEKYEKVWRQCEVFSAASRSATIRRLGEAVQEAIARQEQGATSH